MSESIRPHNPNRSSYLRRATSALAMVAMLGACSEVAEAPIGRSGATITENGGTDNSRTYEFITENGEQAAIDCKGYKFYEVEPGDGLIKIAREEVGHISGNIALPLPHEEAISNFIADINDIENENEIQVGEILELPTNCDIT